MVTIVLIVCDLLTLQRTKTQQVTRKQQNQTKTVNVVSYLFYWYAKDH